MIPSSSKPLTSQKALKARNPRTPTELSCLNLFLAGRAWGPADGYVGVRREGRGLASAPMCISMARIWCSSRRLKSGRLSQAAATCWQESRQLGEDSMA